MNRNTYISYIFPKFMLLSIVIIYSFSVQSCDLFKKKGGEWVESGNNNACTDTTPKTKDIVSETGTGESLDKQTSVDKARITAIANLTNRLVTQVQVAFTDYTHDIEEKQSNPVNNYAVVRRDFEKEIRAYTSILTGQFDVVCEKSFKSTKSTMFKTDIRVQVEKQAFFGSVEEITQKYLAKYKIPLEKDAFHKSQEKNFEKMEKDYEQRKNNATKTN